MPRKNKPPRGLAVIDYETDPFKYGRVPAPFVCGFYDGDVFLEFWGADCVRQLILYLDTRADPLIIYAHNGGKFDFFFMLEYLENPMKIINGRIAKCALGIHELRDSYSAMPVPLRDYKKDKTDYSKFEAEVRDTHRAEIVDYLKSDCVYLYELVNAFLLRFGPRLTIGGAAINELKKFHHFDNQNASHDIRFRPWYFGGRVEAYERGIISGAWKVYDVNSMYPYCMAKMPHPTGRSYRQAFSGIVDKRGRISGFADYPVFFARIQCQQNGAFAYRVEGQPLRFDLPEGEFFVTSHELKAAIETGRVQKIKVLQVLAPQETISFPDYVDTYMREKIEAKKAGDKTKEIFAKLLLNSAYGKFGSNSANYYDFHIQGPDDEPPGGEWEIYMVHRCGANIWRQPARSQTFFDVATAASITGAARAVLMRGLAVAKRPIYCDTDSIICESLPLEMSETALGAWKLEGQGDTLAIAGKKLYALRNGGELVKKANKGALLSDSQIFSVARGGVEFWESDAPSFSLARGTTFTQRKISLR